MALKQGQKWEELLGGLLICWAIFSGSIQIISGINFTQIIFFK
jgi:hypothetical protein